MGYRGFSVTIRNLDCPTRNVESLMHFKQENDKAFGGKRGY